MNRELMEVAGRSLRNFHQDDGLDRAASIAFYSLLSLAPFLYLLGRIVEWFLPGSDALGAAVARSAAFFPDEIAPILEPVSKSLEGHDGLVLLALPGLVWVSTTGFTALERAVNVAFGTSARRRFWLSRLKSFAVVSGAALLLLLSLTANNGLEWLDDYRVKLGLPPALGPGAAWITYLGFLVATFAAFLSFYKMLPRGRVAWRAAGSAALPTLLLWEGARTFFGAVLGYSASFGLLAGTLAGTVAFLLWIYTAAAITLLGAEFAALLNGNRGRIPGSDDPADSP